MHPLRSTLLATILSTAPSLASAGSVGPFFLREDIASARAIKDVIARSEKIPLRKRFSEMTLQEKEVIRGFYTSMGATDEPPFPEAGLAPYVRALGQAQSLILATGDLYLVADVDENGDAQSVTAYGSPHPDLTKFAASALLLEKFKPALCAGTPCPQKFPFSLRFVVR